MQQIFDFPVSSQYRFDNFIVCDGNAAAFRFAQQIAAPSGSERLLYLHGPSGSGKTHLLKAVSTALADSPDGSAPPCLNCRELASASTLLERLAAAPALIMDDLHLLPDDAGIRAAVWQVFNEYYTAGRPVALAGAVPPRELPHLDDHLVSRLLWGLVARVDASDDDSRRMILKKIAADRQVRVTDDVIDFMLATTSRQVGDLISFFEAVFRKSLAEKRRISLVLARQVRNLGSEGRM